jgi:hypothetical protein
MIQFQYHLTKLFQLLNSQLPKTITKSSVVCTIFAEMFSKAHQTPHKSTIPAVD